VGAGGDDDFIFGQFCKALWEFIERDLKTKTHFPGLGFLRKTNIPNTRRKCGPFIWLAIKTPPQ
jgi:hypothetical protein